MFSLEVLSRMEVLGKLSRIRTSYWYTITIILIIPMIFDTHSHCYFEKLAVQIDEVHNAMLASNVTHTVQI